MNKETKQRRCINRTFLNLKNSCFRHIVIFIVFIFIGFLFYAGHGHGRNLLISSTISKLYSSRTRWFVNSNLNYSKFDIVLSYYGEDRNSVARFIRYLRNISTLAKLHPRVIIYNKNSNISLQKLKHATHADVVRYLPNVGREGATYLTHIIENYHFLANHTLFSQAGVEGMTNTGLEDWFQQRLEQQFNPQVGYMPLVANRFIDKYNCDDHASGKFPRLAELWGMLQQTLCPIGGQTVAFRGQFLVSSERIRARSLHIYQYLNELITAGPEHWIHRDPRGPSWESSPNNPVFGHLIERTWTILFNCTAPDLVGRCQRNQCSCLD